jgi:beta-aspartyl-peptidase (threonine type)
MRRVAVVTLVLGFIAYSFVLTLLGARLRRSEAAQDSTPAAIRAVLDRQVEDWNRHDLDGFLDGYWRSPQVVFQSGGDRSNGWEAMRDRYRKRYQAAGKEMGRLVFSGVEIELLGPASAFARGRWELTLSDGSHPGGLFTVIFRKFDGGWKIIHDHTSAAEITPHADPAPRRKQ